MTQRHDSHQEAAPTGAAGHSTRPTHHLPGPNEGVPPATSSACDSPAAVLQRAASAFSAALETGRVRATSMADAEDGAALAFIFVDDQQLQDACGAWKAYLLALIDAPAPAEATAVQRAAAQIGQALFNDPSIPLAEIAARLDAARGAAGTAVAWIIPDAPLPAPELWFDYLAGTLKTVKPRQKIEHFQGDGGS